MKKILLFLILQFLVVSSSQAVTRFYLSRTDTSPVSPAFTSSWEVTASATRGRCSIHNGTSTIGNVGSINASKNIILVRQYVSDPIAAQSISGTVKGQLSGYESNAAMDCVSAVLIKVVSNDGSTTRGTLLGLTYPALTGNEYTTSRTNRYTPASTSLSSVTAQNGDRIVIELGGYAYAKNTYYVYHRYGDGSATDLPEDQTDTNSYNPWIEFSQNIIFCGTKVFVESD